MQLPLLGTWYCTIDSKRRLTLPARLRALIRSIEPAPEVMVTLGHRGCLLVIPPRLWNELSPDLFRAIVGGEEGALRLRSTMARYGSVARIDNSGRISLTEKQIKVAGLSKEAIVFGNFNRIEVWNPSRFTVENPPLEDPAEHDRLMATYLDRRATEGGAP